jgi:geranylgeranyl diphosphate synthase, type I
LARRITAVDNEESVSYPASTDPWTAQLVSRVNARLAQFFDDKRAQASVLTPRAQELVEAVAELTMRGGKRMRPLAIYAGYRAASSSAVPDWDQVVNLGASIELLQTYLLIQDDWMDDDEERRGGPSTHVAFKRQVGEAKLAASLAILAGDIAAGFAFELLHSTQFPPRRAADALKAFTTMHFEVVCGQQLDLLGHEAVTLVHHLKTGSYTVRGPVTLGALLGDASDEQLQALDRFARPLGIAFQLRDDVLGTFGDTHSTGKPAGHDLREGKNTALVSEARTLLSAADRDRLDEVLGNPLASTAAVDAVTGALERSGARARVESELDLRLAEARNALQEGTCLAPEGVGMLLELLSRIAQRDR